MATQTATPTTMAPRILLSSKYIINVTEIKAMPDIGEMSVIPVAWATINAANPSQSVPTTAESAAPPMETPLSREAPKKSATAATVPKISVGNFISSPPTCEPAPAVRAAEARDLSALWIAGNAVTTPINAPPIRTPIPNGRNMPFTTNPLVKLPLILIDAKCQKRTTH